MIPFSELTIDMDRRMISFLAAVAMTCFKVTGYQQRVVNAVAWACVMVTIVWTIFTGSRHWSGSVSATIRNLIKRLSFNWTQRQRS